jgi:hypothetical protein
MELETTQEPGAGGSEPRTFCWYVALMQLPGVATKARLACLQAAHEGLARLPVASRRLHVWHSLQPGLDAVGANELPELALGDTELHGVAAGA